MIFFYLAAHTHAVHAHAGMSADTDTHSDTHTISGSFAPVTQTYDSITDELSFVLILISALLWVHLLLSLSLLLTLLYSRFLSPCPFGAPIHINRTAEVTNRFLQWVDYCQGKERPIGGGQRTMIHEIKPSRSLSFFVSLCGAFPPV